LTENNNNNDHNEQYTLLSKALDEKEKQQKVMQSKLDSISMQQKMGPQIYSELKVQYPSLKSAIIQPSIALSDSASSKKIYLVLLNMSAKISDKEKIKMEDWLKVRLHEDNLNLIFQ
ncbi:MAG: hypothetical protein ACRDE8_00300, partial [Ginsengibacter sp.]